MSKKTRRLLFLAILFLSGCSSEAAVPEDIQGLDGASTVYDAALEWQNSLSPVVTPLLALTISYCAYVLIISRNEQNIRAAENWLYTAIVSAVLFYLLPELFRWISRII